MTGRMAVVPVAMHVPTSTASRAATPLTPESPIPTRGFSGRQEGSEHGGLPGLSEACVDGAPLKSGGGCGGDACRWLRRAGRGAVDAGYIAWLASPNACSGQGLRHTGSRTSVPRAKRHAARGQPRRAGAAAPSTRKRPPTPAMRRARRSASASRSTLAGVRRWAHQPDSLPKEPVRGPAVQVDYDRKQHGANGANLQVDGASDGAVR